MRVLALVPARAGSKGIPGKNSKHLLGKPLLAWTVETALASSLFERVVVSTEDAGLAALAVAAGAEVPFPRPAALASDETPMIDVVVHALDALADEGFVPDAVALLQPTSPLRTPAHLSAAMDLMSPGVEAVCSVVAVPPELSPHYLMRVTADGLLTNFLEEGSRFTRRQDVPPAYRRDGTVYLTRREVLVEQRSFYGRRCVPLVLSAEESVTLDDPEDWTLAERRLAHLHGG